MLVGLPGSGKTTLGEAMAGDDPNITYLDDITVFGGLDELQEAVAFGYENIILSDVFLCRPKDRASAAKWLSKNAAQYEIKWIFFENAPKKCYDNVARRNANGDPRKVGELIKELTQVYTIPEGAEVRAVYEKVCN
jgi:hypothetical protein